MSGLSDSGINLTKLQLELLREWVAALRSGDYEQGLGELIMECDDKKRYCCLGVLCDLNTEKLGIQYEQDPEISPERKIWRIKGSTSLCDGKYAGLLTPEILKQVGLTHEFQQELSQLNDGDCSMTDRSYTFEEIADRIEEYINE